MKTTILNRITFYQTKYDGLAQRERVLIAILILVVIFIVWQLLLVDKFSTHQNTLQQKINLLEQKNNALSTEISAYQHREQQNPNRKLQLKQKALQQRISVQDQQLTLRLKGVISPQKMTQVLEQVFKRNQFLHLIRLDSLKSKAVFEVKHSTVKDKNTGALLLSDTVTENKTIASAAVYQHPVRIEFSGSYLNTLDYVRALENLPWDLYWDEISLQVEEYPRSIISITVYTLSLKKSWLGI